MSFIARLVTVFVFVLGMDAGQALAAEGRSAHMSARLIAESLTVAPGGEVTVAIDYTADKGWHTYWVNPGDAGLATRVRWSLPDNMAAGELRWPTPKILPTLGLTSYGFDGRTLLLTTIRNESTLTQGEALPLRARVDFLVCSDVCIPENLEVSLTLKVGAPSPSPDAGDITRARAALPTPSSSGTIHLKDGLIELGFPTVGLAPANAYFFIEQEGVISAGAAQSVDVGPGGFSLRVASAKPALPEGPLSGVLKLADGKAYSVRLERAPLSAEVHGLGAAAGGAQDRAATTVLLAALGALLGGMILNLMPCVFPVLSMKLLSLSRAGHDKGLARVEALAYGGGVLLSFLALAGIIVLARALGAQIGWGFQLQSPYVTAALAVVMLLVALNMSGVFHVGAALQRLGGEVPLDERRPRLAAFLTGVLAVVVAAPCTAPFMGPAIGIALTQGGVTGVTIFAALGLGFALPFVVLTFVIISVPAVARLLPRPGPWMTWVQRGLSLLMYAAALWLVWVFAQQVSGLGLGLLIAALVLVATGLAVRRLPLLMRIMMVVGAIVTGVFAATHTAPPAARTVSDSASHTPFDMSRLTQLRAEGKPVLVDMTAAWCITCKVNEIGVLNTPEVTAALRDSGTVYMVGDWTNQDEAISRYLNLFGRSGVPLYVWYGKGKAEPVVLPQMLDKASVISLIKKGA